MVPSAVTPSISCEKPSVPDPSCLRPARFAPPVTLWPDEAWGGGPNLEHAGVGEHLKEHIGEVRAEWEMLVRERGTPTVPAPHGIDSLPRVVAGLAEISLCNPISISAHRRLMDDAAEYGYGCRTHGVPQHLIPAGYQLLHEALRSFLSRKFRHDSAGAALVQLRSATTLAINGSMWGYYRPEIQALGRWERGMERLILLSPFLRRNPYRER